MKRFFILLVAILFISPRKISAAEQDVRLTDIKLKVNGNSKIYYSYNIDGDNYYRLTDIAKALRDTNKSFDVIYDKDEDAIYILRRRNFQDESMSIYKYNDQAFDSESRLFIENREVIIPGVKISGHSYYNIRDIASILDFGVRLDPSDRSIFIDTNFEYTSKGDENLKVPDFSKAGSKEEFIDQFTKSYFDIYDMQTKVVSDLMKNGSNSSSLSNLQKTIINHEKYYKQIGEIDFIKNNQATKQAYEKFMSDYEIQKDKFNQLIEESRSIKYDDSQESIYEYNKSVMELSESFIDLLNKLKAE